MLLINIMNQHGSSSDMRFISGNLLFNRGLFNHILQFRQIVFFARDQRWCISQSVLVTAAPLREHSCASSVWLPAYRCYIVYPIIVGYCWWIIDMELRFKFTGVSDSRDTAASCQRWWHCTYNFAKRILFWFVRIDILRTIIGIFQAIFLWNYWRERSDATKTLKVFISATNRFRNFDYWFIIHFWIQVSIRCCLRGHDLI